MNFKSAVIVILLVVFEVLVEGGAPRPRLPFNKWAIFGDSLTDTGNIFTEEGFPNSPPYFKGRYSNGPVWIEYLAAILNLPAPKASLQHGINYAYGGATTGYGISENICCTTYCCLYSNGKKPEFGLNSGNQTLNYLKSHRPDSETLIVIWIGANDIIDFIPLNVTMINLANDISLLIEKGAKYFLVLNMPDLGLAPLFFNTPLQEIATYLALEFNGALQLTLASIEANFPKVTFYTPNLFAFSSDIEFINERGVYDQTGQALSRVNVQDPTSRYILNVNASVDAWWDYEHPTTKLHRAVADYIAINTFNVRPLLTNSEKLIADAAKNQAAINNANTLFTTFTSVFLYCSLLLNILFLYF